jgi:hypothetical protein
MSAMTPHASFGCSLSRAEQNRQLVLALYQEALISRNVRTAFERYVSEDFVEHWDVVSAPGREQRNPNPRF